MDSPALTSFPLLTEAQQVTQHKEIGKIIARSLLKKEALAFIMKGLTPPGARLDISWNSTVIALGSCMIGIIESGKLNICSVESARLVQTIAPETWEGRLFAKKNKEGDKVVTGIETYDNKGRTLRVWSVADGNCLHIINPGGAIKYVQFRSMGDQELLIAASHNFVKMWSVHTGLLCACIEKLDSEIDYVKADPQGEKIFVAFKDRTPPKVWDLRSSSSMRTLEDLSLVYKAKFSPSGNLVCIISFLAEGVGIYSVAKGEWLFKGGKIMERKGTQAIIWDAQSKNALIVGIRNLPDNRLAFLLTSNGSEDQSFIKRSLWHGEEDACIATFNKTGDRIISTGRDKIAKLWCGNTIECIHELIGHGGIIDALCFNDAGDRALTHSSLENTVKVWDVQTGLCLYSFPSWSKKSFFSGDIIVTAGGDSVCLHRILEIEALLKDITFEQAFLINSIYEIIILRRLATIRSSAQLYHAFMNNEDLNFLEESRLTAFCEKLKKLRGRLTEFFSELGGEPRPIMTEEGKILQRDDFIFDFTNKPESLLATYRGLAKPIRSMLNPFVKLPAAGAELEDSSSDPESTSADESKNKEGESYDE